jgi:hypothetical protein
MALGFGLAIGAASPAFAFSPNHDASKIAAEKTLARVTLDVDKANFYYSLVDPQPSVRARYSNEYVSGRRALETGQYDEAIVHLRKADQIIRSMLDWIELE